MTAASTAEGRTRTRITLLAASLGAWVRAFADNPVLVRDGRSVFRGRRVFLLQLAYLGALGATMGVTGLAYYQSYLGYGGHPARAAVLPEYGRWMFIATFEVQVVLLLIAVVAYSAASICLEREKQTYEMLAITRLGSLEVVLGKVASVTSLCLLLLLTSAPIAAICMLFGGVSPGEICLSYCLLALKLPLWASLGVLVSVVVGRSIGAYVAGIVAAGIELSLSLVLTMPYHQPGVDSLGLFNPMLAPFASEGANFVFLGLSIWPWLLPIPYHLLLTGLAVVGAAEGMEHYRPRRSAWLRSMLLALTFYGALVLTALWHQSTSGPTRAPLIAAFGTVWLYVCCLLPVFTSYPPGAGGAPLRWLLSPISVRGCLRQDPTVGPVFCLCIWAAGVVGVVAALAMATAVGGAASPRWGITGAHALWYAAGALAIYALSIVAYGAWGVALAVVHRARREVAAATVLMMLALNVLGLTYGVGYEVLRGVPTHPALVLASPACAASAVLSAAGGPSVWRRYGAANGLLFGIGYSLLLLASALWYSARQQKTAGEAGVERVLPKAPREEGQPSVTVSAAAGQARDGAEER